MTTTSEAIKPGMTLGLLLGTGDTDTVAALYPVHEVTAHGVIFWNTATDAPSKVWRWSTFDDRGASGFVQLLDAKGRPAAFKVLSDG